MLREFLLRGRGDRDVAAKHDGARGGGALVDGEDERHELPSFPERGSLLSRQRERIRAARSRLDQRARLPFLLPLREKVARSAG